MLKLGSSSVKHYMRPSGVASYNGSFGQRRFMTEGARWSAASFYHLEDEVGEGVQINKFQRRNSNGLVKSWKAVLNYQRRPNVPNLGIGRHAPGRAKFSNEEELEDEVIPLQMAIRDARWYIELGVDPYIGRLDTSGFELVKLDDPRHEAVYDKMFVKNLSEELERVNKAEVRKVYYPMVRELVTNVFQERYGKNAIARVLPYHHKVLNSRLDGSFRDLGDVLPEEKKFRVHCDVSPKSWADRLKRIAAHPDVQSPDKKQGILRPLEWTNMLKNRDRYAIVSVWRSLDEESPVLRDPLAFADPRTVTQSNALDYMVRHLSHTGVRSALPSEDAGSHHWYYYPDMTHKEALVYNVYDSGKNECLFRSAFQAPAQKNISQNNLLNLPDRRSIETQVLVVFEPEKLFK